MPFLVVGLGNPGEEYAGTRHNAGRIALEVVRREFAFPDFAPDPKRAARVSRGARAGRRVLLALPEVFMNESGGAVKRLLGAAGAQKLVVLHDDLDLPLGTVKISKNRGPAGHRGVASVIRALKTRDFLRVRIGVSPKTPGGKTKKPRGEERVLSFLMGTMRPEERRALAKAARRAALAIDTVLSGGVARAMTEFNR